ncbi:MAG: beta-lactamase family protein [Acidobacteriia bacterium]|nr:beta-lactamase family protein [Terriglobia bacterium]
MLKSQIPRWASIMLLGVGLLVVGIPGLWLYISATAPKLHPSPQNVSSVTNSSSLAKWTAAVEKGREIVRTSLSEKNLPGISVAVGVAGDIVWAEGFGFANFENSLPVTLDDRFPIGTAATVFTSAAIGLLLEEGRMKLDDDIQAYVPGFPQKQWPLTIRHLMAHVGGVKTEDWDEGVLIYQHCERPSDALNLFAKDPLSFQPGTEYRYSTFGWILLSAAVETAAGKPFQAFLQDRVFLPLGMLNTVKESGVDAVPDEVTFYVPRFLANPRYGLNPLPLHKFDYSCHAGSSGFVSTPSDLVRFGMAINGSKLLRRDTVQTLQTSQRTTSGMETGYGLGWDLHPVTFAGKQVRTAGHNGDFWGGPVASLLTFPERGIVVAVTSNIAFADTHSIAVKIAEKFVQ